MSFSCIEDDFEYQSIKKLIKDINLSMGRTEEVVINHTTELSRCEGLLMLTPQEGIHAHHPHAHLPIAQYCRQEYGRPRKHFQFKVPSNF